ncbi:hypothetical protein ARMGADRAFT_813507 [Armillaria gallica]|uniref:Heterokaryon incompatibility domain-containing protein n=1 Tax=Armillaria gallica TaxID=47427 RepID=A0A2H3CPT7_ARMGA|nr:hypothetical protein ARMGADRAFT_813507 [Armillaria gallica]
MAWNAEPPTPTLSRLAPQRRLLQRSPYQSLQKYTTSFAKPAGTHSFLPTLSIQHGYPNPSRSSPNRLTFLIPHLHGGRCNDGRRASGARCSAERSRGSGISTKRRHVQEEEVPGGGAVRAGVRAGRHLEDYIYRNILQKLDDPAARFIRDREVFYDVDSPKSYNLIKKCIDECSRHDRCPPPRHRGVRLLTRVIDCADEDQPRLFFGQGTEGNYVALSYVWGENQPHCTKATNLDSYTEAIPLQNIPQTISDAITVTRKLGLRFLWVGVLRVTNPDHHHHRLYSPRWRVNVTRTTVSVRQGWP